MSIRRSLALTAAVMLAITLAPTPAQAQAKPPAPSGQSPIAAPDHALGSRWNSSDDVAVVGSGDSDGYHLYVAREKDAFSWRTLATLKSSSIDVGPWSGAVCVTG